MQLFLPMYPQSTKMLSNNVGVFELEGIVNYIANGMPIYSHGKDDLSSYRYITSNLIDKNLVTKREVVKFFGVSEISVSRYYKKFKERGANAFFGFTSSEKKCYKLLGELLKRVQEKLDKGMSNYKIAIEEDISEGTIRYALQQGRLKKKSL